VIREPVICGVVAGMTILCVHDWLPALIGWWLW
jgi:type IV secretory pathway TrbD component